MNTRQRINQDSATLGLSEKHGSPSHSLPPFGGEGLEQVYRQRARQFAARGVAAAGHVDTRQVLTFTVGTERLCLDLAMVVEILPYAKCSPIPGAAPELLGVINVRGRICAVLNLSSILELLDDGPRDGGYILLVRHAGLDVGLRTDKVDQIEVITRDELEGWDDSLGALSPKYVTGRTASRVAVLNIGAVFSHPVFSSGLKAGRADVPGLNIEGHPPHVATVPHSERIIPGGSHT